MGWDYTLALFITWFTACFDAHFTAERIARYSEHIELNTLIRYFVRRFGTTKGTWLGVLIPTGLITILSFYFRDALIFLAGARTTLFAFQWFQLGQTRR